MVRIEDPAATTKSSVKSWLLQYAYQLPVISSGRVISTDLVAGREIQLPSQNDKLKRA